jgi:aspartate-semialdehyde dehydrogenase
MPDTQQQPVGATLGVRPLNVGVVGATGNVGTVMLEVLAERGFPIASIRAFASARSVGRTVPFNDANVQVESLEDADPSGLDVALFSAGKDRALIHAPRFAAAGVICIDNSSAFRMEDDVPLVVPEVNPHALEGHSGVIANPNCSTIQLVAALKPIHDAVGLERVQISTYQSVSGTGLSALRELARQTADLTEGRPVQNVVYPHQIAFNVIPHCDTFDEDGNTQEELKLIRETRKILELPELRVSATCVRVPVPVAHSEAVHIETRDALSANDARELLAAAPGVEVVDDPAANEYPMPINASGKDEVFVGRIRRDDSVPNGLAMFVVADNLRKGAATNAIQIAETLALQGAWS